MWSLHAIESQPDGVIHPHSTVFLIIVGWVWPIYFLVRSAVGAFIGGLVKDIPFKLPAVGLLWVLYHNLIQQARKNVGAGASGCTDYVAIQMQYLSAFILGYLFIATILKEFAVREHLYVWLRRRARPKWALALDGLAAVGLAAISAPWFLEGARYMLQLPPSPVISRSLFASGRLLTLPKTGYGYGHLFGGGQSFIESFAEALNKKLSHISRTMPCSPDQYTGGGWLVLATVASIFLLPAAVGVSLPWLSSSNRLRSIVDFEVNDTRTMAFADTHKEAAGLPGLLGLEITVVLSWLVLKVMVSGF